jgi:hypothetical protein
MKKWRYEPGLVSCGYLVRLAQQPRPVLGAASDRATPDAQTLLLKGSTKNGNLQQNG